MAISLTLSNQGFGRRKFSRKALGRRISGYVVGVLGIAIAVAVGEYFVATATPGAPISAAATAVFSGEYSDGVPVYRLPPITVVAHGDAEASK